MATNAGAGGYRCGVFQCCVGAVQAAFVGLEACIRRIHADRVQTKNRAEYSWGKAGKWSAWQDSNLRPLRPERSALPSCATRRSTAGIIRIQLTNSSPEPDNRASANALRLSYISTLAPGIARAFRLRFVSFPLPVRTSTGWQFSAAPASRSDRKSVV